MICHQMFDLFRCHLSISKCGTVSFLLCIMLTVVSSTECPRRPSKIVRKIIREEIRPLYEELSVEIPRDCPLVPSRDVFGHQEDNKYEESSTKWTCNFCGKSFQEERFLDQHFMNRHPESLRKDSDIVCLADYCDIFRCEVVTVTYETRSNYWEQALCREGDLQKKQTKCLQLIPSCIPSMSDDSTRNTLIVHLNHTLCRYLTCEMYWELNENQMSPLSIVFYMMASMILVFGLCVYFMVLRVQLSENPPKLLRTLSQSSEDDPPPMFFPESQAIRHRHRYH